MGIVVGYVEPKAGEVWDRLYPAAASPRADLTTWAPDVICINYGENDASFTSNNGQTFPAQAFTEGYVALVQAIRAAYPAAHIVLLRGGMHNGAKHDGLRLAWEETLKQLAAADPKIHHFVFNHWSGPHPRVADARAMADELTAWLQAQEFMAAYK